MDEDIEAVRGWMNLNRSVYPNLGKDIEVFKARERARLTVLDLTEFDRRLLHQCKVSPE